MCAATSSGTWKVSAGQPSFARVAAMASAPERLAVRAGGVLLGAAVADVGCDDDQRGALVVGLRSLDGRGSMASRSLPSDTCCTCQP